MSCLRFSACVFTDVAAILVLVLRCLVLFALIKGRAICLVHTKSFFFKLRENGAFKRIELQRTSLKKAKIKKWWLFYVKMLRSLRHRKKKKRKRNEAQEEEKEKKKKKIRFEMRKVLHKNFSHTYYHTETVVIWNFSEFRTTFFLHSRCVALPFTFHHHRRGAVSLHPLTV